MTALDNAAAAWKADATTAEVLATLRPAGLRIVRKLVKAVKRSDTSHGYQDCRSALKVQGLSRDSHVNLRRMPVARVRSLNGRAN